MIVARVCDSFSISTPSLASTAWWRPYRDRRESLGLLLDLDALLRLDRLVETVGPATPGEDAASELVDDVDVVFLHDIVDVAFVEAVGAEKLVDDMDSVGLLDERGLRVAAALKALLLGERSVAVDRAHLGREVG